MLIYGGLGFQLMGFWACSVGPSGYFGVGAVYKQKNNHGKKLCVLHRLYFCTKYMSSVSLRCFLMMEMDSSSGFSPYHAECMMLSVVVISFDIGQVFMLGCLDNEISDSHATFSYKQGCNIQFYEKWKLGKPFLLSHYMSEITMISVMWYNLQTIDRKHFLGSKYFPQSKLQIDRGFYMIYGLWHCHGNVYNYTESLLFIPWHFWLVFFCIMTPYYYYVKAEDW